jgi:hypothetical protein
LVLTKNCRPLERQADQPLWLALWLSRSYRLVFQIREGCEHIPAQLLVPGNVQFSPCEVLLTGIIAGGDAQGKLAVFFIGNPYIDVADQLAHDLGGLAPR